MSAPRDPPRGAARPLAEHTTAAEPARPALNTFVCATTAPLLDPPSPPHPTHSSPTAPPTITSPLGPDERLAPWPAVALRAAVLAVLALLVVTTNLAASQGEAVHPPDGAGLIIPAAAPARPRPPTIPEPNEPAAAPRPHAPVPASTPASDAPNQQPFPRRRALAALEPALPALRLCAARNRVWGVLRVALAVESDGRISRLTLHDPVVDRPLETCLFGQVRALRLPQHPRGATLEITLDIPAFLPVDAAR
ncbi:MAG: hypothetical protein IPK80_22195 [Nannocystis sp.]|nr:hypothetical protein [Nannocystis sp.]